MSWICLSAPCYKREWILPHYFKAIESQTWPTDDLGFIFNTSPDDDATLECLLAFGEKHPELRCFEILCNRTVQHTDHEDGKRKWTIERYSVMAQLRNEILENASVRLPDRLFSLDTDILLESPNTIKDLYDLDLDCVSPLTYMTPTGNMFPNIMTWNAEPGGKARRDFYPIGNLFKADIIMAAVMMKPKAYQNLRYSTHRQGEDLSLAYMAYQQNIEMYSASYLEVKHIMFEKMLG